MTDSPKNRSRKLMEDFAKFEAWLLERFPVKDRREYYKKWRRENGPNAQGR